MKKISLYIDGLLLIATIFILRSPNWGEGSESKIESFAIIYC